MLLIDGKHYEWQPLPGIYFGHQKPLAYVLNPKVASTLTINFLFYLNNGYRYFSPYQLYRSPYALMQLRGPELNPAHLAAYARLAPERFTIVRDPLRRFASAFLSKVFTDDDPAYEGFRDFLTSLHGIDLSPEADPKKTCVAFAKWVAAQDDQWSVDPHFRPQHLNLAIGSRFTIDTILRIEDQAALSAYVAKWIGEEKAKWILSFRFNEQTGLKADDCISDELEAIVRQIFARDYELFYPNA